MSSYCRVDPAKHLGKEIVETNSIGLQMVLIPPGEFLMGSTNKEYNRLMEVARGPSASPSKTRVLRGGWFDGDPLINRPAFRVQANQNIGFRVVREVNDGDFKAPQNAEPTRAHKRM